MTCERGLMILNRGCYLFMSYQNLILECDVDFEMNL